MRHIAKSQSLRKSGQFLQEAVQGDYDHLLSRNPFVSQVNFFYSKEGAIQHKGEVAIPS